MLVVLTVKIGVLEGPDRRPGAELTSPSVALGGIDEEAPVLTALPAFEMPEVFTPRLPPRPLLRTSNEEAVTLSLGEDNGC